MFNIDWSKIDPGWKDKLKEELKAKKPKPKQWECKHCDAQGIVRNMKTGDWFKCGKCVEK